MNNQNDIIKLAKVKVNSVNRWRRSDDKRNFVTANVVNTVAGIQTHSIDNHMKDINVPKSTPNRLFRRDNTKGKQLIDDVDDINWSSEKKRIKTYSKLNYNLMIQIQDWIVKHHNVIHSPITENTLLIKDECTGKYFY